MLFARNLIRISFAMALPFCALSQKEAPIELRNPSFEDVPRASATPTGWYDCGQMRDSPPDVQPGFWQVTTPPKDGSSYLGMVVRDDETWESVSQRLSRPLEANQCYELRMDLCKAPKYVSKSPRSVDETDFVTPAIVQIYGGNGYCDRAELLARSTIINHSRWIGYNFRLSPKKSNYSFILIEVYYKLPLLFPYNGHVLFDNLSAITPIVCGPEKMPVSTKKPSIPVAAKGPTKTAKEPTPKTVTSSSKTSVKTESKPESIGNSSRKSVVYRLEKVYFDADKYDIKPESEAQLEELVQFLLKRPDVTIEVGGHTNNQMWPNDAFALELSTNRAKAVAEWIISRGVPASQVQYKGYGWTKPIMPNTSAEGRLRNQRVEATIISSNG